MAVDIQKMDEIQGNAAHSTTIEGNAPAIPPVEQFTATEAPVASGGSVDKFGPDNVVMYDQKKPSLWQQIKNTFRSN